METTKVLNPGRTPEGWPVYLAVKVTGEEDKRLLSIVGVEGPMRNGNAHGACGQIVDFTLGKLSNGWTLETVERLREVWREWHLNDMSPECEHQRAAGWRERAGERVNLYFWNLDSEALKAQNRAREAAQEALRAGETFTPTPEQVEAAGRPWELVTWTPEQPEHYKPRSEGINPRGHVEVEALGWLTPEKHPEGLLTRPCEVCEYRYGSAWLFREVPADVWEFLESLPASETVPAWV